MTPEPKEIGHQVRFSKSLIGLFKRSCWEIPEIMGSSCMALIGIGLGIAGVYKYYKEDGDNKEYKQTYLIVRPSDPRASKIINPSYTEYKC
ncbi:uncharacterized protein LOC119191053 [Manduca sexta]|uniref:uncharacterized protein LOC119191053 n=1 Tax=Manduca sexta TaxID=7130 RepID=UPI00188E4A87|nr:uncharacterized protein LOC119191053 [Manduca sexta]